MLHRFTLLEAVLGPKGADALKVEGRKCKAEQDGGFHPTEDSEEPRFRSTKEPLSAAFTDSTTWRLPIEVRQAVVP